MKRYTKEHAQQVAKDFATSTKADAWYLFGSDIRSAIIDSLVVHEFRIADMVDSSVAVTAAEVMEFRALIELALAEGIKRRNAPPRRFRVHED